MSSFEDTVKNLIKMKPKPHKPKADSDEVEGDEEARRPPASNSSKEGR